MPEKLSADCVVVGAGGAGLAAALAAATLGRRVLVLEATSTLGGTTATSGGNVYAPGHHLGAEPDHPGDREQAFRYVQAASRRALDPVMVRRFLNSVPVMVRAFEDAGVRWEPTRSVEFHPDAPGARRGRILRPAPFQPSVLGPLAHRVRRSPYFDAATPPWTAGMSLVGQLVAACARAGVQFRTGAHVRRLDAPDGRVEGLEATTPDGPLSVSSGHVVLTTGGYAANRDLQQRWAGLALEASRGCPAEEGDALALAGALGADTRDLDGLGFDALIRPNGDEYDGQPLFLAAATALPGSIAVDRRGRRFGNEADVLEFPTALAGADRPAWLVMDQRHVDTYQQLAFGPAVREAPFFLDARNLAELASLIGVPAGALTDAVRTFNQGAVEGADPLYQRGAAKLDRAYGDRTRDGALACLAPLDAPPFHATRLYLGGSTRGGLVVDAAARVLRPDGTAIPGLHAAGLATTQPIDSSSSGWTLGPALTFGYIAGRSTATPAPRPRT